MCEEMEVLEKRKSGQGSRLEQHHIQGGTQGMEWVKDLEEAGALDWGLDWISIPDKVGQWMYDGIETCKRVEVWTEVQVGPASQTRWDIGYGMD